VQIEELVLNESSVSRTARSSPVAIETRKVPSPVGPGRTIDPEKVLFRGQ